MADPYSKDIWREGQGYRGGRVEQKPLTVCDACGARHSAPVYWCAADPSEHEDDDDKSN